MATREPIPAGYREVFFYDHIAGEAVRHVVPIPAAEATTAPSPVAEAEKPAPVDGAPEWVRMLDPEHQARMFEKNEYGWYRWTDCNPTVELLIQLLTDLRNDRPARPGRHRIEP